MCDETLIAAITALVDVQREANQIQRETNALLTMAVADIHAVMVDATAIPDEESTAHGAAEVKHYMDGTPIESE